jgi:hypothetical protein
MGNIGCPETSVRNYHCTLRKNQMNADFKETVLPNININIIIIIIIMENGHVNCGTVASIQEL